MAEYIIHETNQVVNYKGLQAYALPTVLPRVLSENTLNSIGTSVVFPTPKPEASTNLHMVIRNGAVEDGINNWVQAWVEVDRFTEYTNADSVVVTKAEQDTKYIVTLTETAKANKLKEVKELHLSHLYKDVEVTFPSGLATIQFRDEVDRANLGNAASGAIANVLAGNPTTPMDYRTLDNETQIVPASDMLNIAMSVLGIKQAKLDNCWAHKDNINALTTIASIEAYDITTGW